MQASAWCSRSQNTTAQFDERATCKASSESVLFVPRDCDTELVTTRPLIGVMATYWIEMCGQTSDAEVTLGKASAARRQLTCGHGFDVRVKMCSEKGSLNIRARVLNEMWCKTSPIQAPSHSGPVEEPATASVAPRASATRLNHARTRGQRNWPSLLDRRIGLT